MGKTVQQKRPFIQRKTRADTPIPLTEETAVPVREVDVQIIPEEDPSSTLPQEPTNVEEVEDEAEETVDVQPQVEMAETLPTPIDTQAL